MVKCGDCSRFKRAFFSSYDNLSKSFGLTIFIWMHFWALVVNNAFRFKLYPAFNKHEDRLPNNLNQKIISINQIVLIRINANNDALDYYYVIVDAKWI